VDPAQPRLRPGSPAIDAADSLTLAFGLLFNGLPITDGDGLRRFKGADGKADVGAFEFGDTSFTHTASAANLVANYISVIDDPALNGTPAAVLIATPDYNAGAATGVAYDHPFGAYYSSGSWRLFNQDTIANGPLPAGTHFDVFAPAAGSGSFVHVSSAANVSGSGTAFSDSSSDGLPDSIVLVTQNWTAGAASIYNAHPVGVFYGGDALWHVANLDGAAMAYPLGFNVYAQAPSPNAFRAVATPGNSFGGALFLDHPLLNDTPCARPHATRVLAGTAGDGFDVEYLGGRWLIFDYGGTALGDVFNVLVDPAQVDACIDRIFADSFQ
jgi:hypothetical protein